MGGRGGSSGLEMVKKDNKKDPNYFDRKKHNIGMESDYDSSGALKNLAHGLSFDANKLQGTEKQISYAQDIINKSFSYIDRHIEEEQKLISNFPPNYDNARNQVNAKIASFIYVKRAIYEDLKSGKINTAKEIIEKKSKFTNGFEGVRDNIYSRFYKMFTAETLKKKGLI